MSETNSTGRPPEVDAELRRRARGNETPGGSGAAGAYQAERLDWPSEQPSRPKQSPGDWFKRLGPVGALLAVLAGKLKFLLIGAKFQLPLLKTGGTMLLSMWFYSTVFGWKFAAGFVLCILVHELGHVFAAWRLGMPVSAPLFIPGMGAVIFNKRCARGPWEGALVGIGGPLGGTLAALACLGAYQLTGNKLLLALTFTGAFLNLFNLLPVFPLDGGWITGAVSPRIWLIGAIVLGAAVVTGHIHNPMIIILLLVSLPRLWQGIRHGDITPPGGIPVTPQQRVSMGLAYVGLAGFLAWLMVFTHAAA